MNLWPEDVPNRTLVVLAGKDNLIHVDEVIRQAGGKGGGGRGAGEWKGGGSFAASNLHLAGHLLCPALPCPALPCPALLLLLHLTRCVR